MLCSNKHMYSNVEADFYYEPSYQTSRSRFILFHPIEILIDSLVYVFAVTHGVTTLNSADSAAETRISAAEQFSNHSQWRSQSSIAKFSLPRAAHQSQLACLHPSHDGPTLTKSSDKDADRWPTGRRFRVHGRDRTQVQDQKIVSRRD